MGGMLQPQSVSFLMQARQVDDGVPKERVPDSVRRDTDIHNLADGFSVQPGRGSGPNHLNLRFIAIPGPDEMETAVRSLFPCLESPASQLLVSRHA